MLDNLSLLAGLITVLWLGTFVYYIYSSRQQRQIKDELETLRAMLGKDGEGDV